MARETASLPISFSEQLAKEAQDIKSRISAPSGDRIRFNANRSFTTPDGMEGEVLEVVVVDFLSSNMFYDSAYDRDNVQPPACFAIGPEPALLVPSENSPNKQSETCATCPNNQFGSANNGKGKACKNTRLVAVTPLNDPATPVWLLAVPPTSIRAFDAYVQGLASKQKTLPIGVLTHITMDEKSQYASPRFEVNRPLTEEELAQVFPLRAMAQDRLIDEPDVSSYVAPKRPVRRI